MFKENKNKVETIIKTSEEAPSSRLNGSQRLKESGLILAFLFSIFLAVALLVLTPLIHLGHKQLGGQTFTMRVV